MTEPLEFTLAVQDFDLFLLAEDSRDTGSERFRQAVALFYAEQFAPLEGIVKVQFEGRDIHVSWLPAATSQHPLEYAVALLNAGQFAQALPILDALRAAHPDDANILFNLGMANSDLGHLERAVRWLERSIELDPNNANAWVALGMAQERSGALEEATLAFEKAVEISPENGYAQRNLGVMLARRGSSIKAETYLRAAVRLMPDDQSSVFNLAQCLARLGGEDYSVEADALYERVMRIDSQSDIAEMAKAARRRLAEKTFRSQGNLPIRMDAVQYCLDAMKTFEDMDRNQVEKIAFEIAMLGRSGLDVNNPARQYTLRSLAGEYSGLNLLCIMFIGFKQIAPDKDLGFDLTNEYALAQKMFQSEKSST